jgi:hypothetical protein
MVNTLCQINNFKIVKVPNTLTGVVEENFYHITIDKDGVLRIYNFENFLNESIIYVEAAAK